ncbi:hypothetical protein K461DRAFT_224599 [Myriangium duriaei CBS 260.36]|uniref:Acyltransferase 3 domain-containing protein n=1 Tax=Myriangium duriaei CBS 260.36 TaxID=1168546 RepID=A0A9P4J097_9PEZI|nr:hypothetical protein K461DRAFT_224599 [Myriangium duriaei CBS 260.36]
MKVLSTRFWQSLSSKKFQRLIFWRKTSSGNPNQEKAITEIKLHRTAYLDGLRGFAALIVTISHHTGWSHSKDLSQFLILESPWGHNGQYYTICAPLIRNLFSGGHLAVAIFFTISGYVLSSKALALMHTGDMDKLARNLSSALFRRWVRLYYPVIVTTFIFMTSWHVLSIRSSNTIQPEPEKTYIAEVQRWYRDTKVFSFVFDPQKPWNPYNDHTWSIPVEFRGSIAIFTSLLAFSSFTRQKRLLCETVLIFYFLIIVNGWASGCFCIGLLICDLDLLATRDDLPEFLSRHRPKGKSGTLFYSIILLIGLYVGGVPTLNDVAELRQAAGWYYLSFLKPRAFAEYARFYRTWGAGFIMVATVQLPWLRTFFETRICQFLGKVSFSLYLVHGPILWTLGDRFYAATGRPSLGTAEYVADWVNLYQLPEYGLYGLEVNAVIPFTLLLVITLGVAWVATKTIDEPAVKLGRWLFNLDFERKDESSL